MCPPNGRRGRDCSNNAHSANQPPEPGMPSNSGVSLVESLLVFPKNLFWDSNHLDKPIEMEFPDLATQPSSSRTVTNTATVVGVAPTTTMAPSSTKETFSGSIDKSRDTSNKDQTRLSNTVTLQVNDLKLIETTTKVPNPTTNNVAESNHGSPEQPMNSNIPNLGVIGNNNTSKRNTPNSIDTTPSPELIPRDGASLLSIRESKGLSATITSLPNISGTPSDKINENVINEGMRPQNNENPSSSTPLAPSALLASSTPDFQSQIGQGLIGNRFKESFPRHDSFPTFFSGDLVNVQQETSDDKPNAAVSLFAHRVFQQPDPFPFFRRNRLGRIITTE